MKKAELDSLKKEGAKQDIIKKNAPKAHPFTGNVHRDGEQFHVDGDHQVGGANHWVAKHNHAHHKLANEIRLKAHQQAHA